MTGGKGMAYANILLERNEEIMVIRLNRPEVRNPLTHEMGMEFREAIENIKKDTDIKGLIVTGNGQSFSAGGDMKLIAKMAETVAFQNKENVLKLYQNFLSIRTVKIPTIAAVNGHAIGAGACLALACDLRIASEKASFGFTFINLGLHPGMGATYLLPRIIGVPRAYYLLASGEILDSAEAYRIGLVDKVVKAEDLMAASMEKIRKISSMPMVAVKMLKESIYAHLEEPSLEKALEREAANQALTFTTRDVKEGIAAVTERRKGIFTDKI